MRTLTCFAVVLTAACGGGGQTNVDSGNPVDTSCGIDCKAQTTFGLLVGTCFEYSPMNTSVDPTATLAAEVYLPNSPLEGDVKVMQVVYKTGGQIQMTDSFAIDGQTLKLARREFGGTGSNSVTYQTGSAITGVEWLTTTSASGETHDTSTTYRVIGANANIDAGTYTVTTADPTAGELSVPFKKYDSGLKLLFSESPDHGVDSRRVFVPETGFTLISTPLMQGGGTSNEYRLQNVKNTADAGACGF